MKSDSNKGGRIEFARSNFSIRLATKEDVSAIRTLVNASYKELSDKGWNYTATYQDKEVTWSRMQQGRAFVIEFEQKIIATILFFTKNFFTGKNTAYVGQFAVAPEFKKNGIGTFLMDYCENLALSEAFEGIQLDTAQPAEHLVKWYLKRGYRIVGETHWEGKTYRSYIFEKLF